MKHNLIRYLEALNEARRELERCPADDWEDGQLVALYGAVIQAAKNSDAVPPALASATKVYDRQFERSLLHLSLGASRVLWNFCNTLESFLGEITSLSEILIMRHWPHSSIEIEAYVEEASSGKIQQLNDKIREMGLPQAQGMRSLIDVWLSSFDRPDYLFHESPLHTAVLNGEYWVKTRPIASSNTYRMAGIVDTCRSAIEFIEACLVIVRRIVLVGGAVLRSIATR